MNKKLILIAEDDADDRLLLQEAFVETGFTGHVDFVLNGKALLSYLYELLEKDVALKILPSFILLDLNMPLKNGLEVLLEIKIHPVLKKIPVNMFTTSSNEQNIAACYEAGANSYIVKPNSYEGLVKVVKKVQHYWIDTARVPYI